MSAKTVDTADTVVRLRMRRLGAIAETTVAMIAIGTDIASVPVAGTGTVIATGIGTAAEIGTGIASGIGTAVEIGTGIEMTTGTGTVSTTGIGDTATGNREEEIR